MRAAVVDDLLPSDDPFRAAAELGFEGLEIVLPRQFTHERVAAAASAKARWGVEVPSLILGRHNIEGGVADSDPRIAARARDDVRAAIEMAGVLGADTVLVPFFVAADLPDEAAVERCAIAFEQLCPEAERTGVTLCFEGSLPAVEILRLARRIDSSSFRCYFDPANVLVAGLEPAAEARALGALIRRVHLKDTRDRRGDCRLGDGRVDFAACAAALADLGYDGWLVIEGPRGDVADVARDLSFARSVFPGLRR